MADRQGIEPMKRNQLTVNFVRQVSKPGRYIDGYGLMLMVRPTGAKSWVQRVVIHGRRRDLGLGPVDRVTLAQARKIAFENRNIAREGGDPAAIRNRPAVPTFAEALEKVIEIHRGTWKDAGKSESQWRASLRNYALPRLGRIGVDNITTADVMAVLVPHWQSKHETMRRVRQRIGAVMKWAIAQGYRTDNPAGEAIGAALPKGSGRKVEHHRALAHGEVSDAITTVRASSAWWATKAAVEFVILTACRFW